VPGRFGSFLTSLRLLNRPFWVANVSELFERVAFYGTKSMLALYLIRSRGLEEAETYRLLGNFGLLVFGLPVLSGFLADMMGYRRAMMLAYAFLAGGYFLVGQLTTYWSIAGALLLVAFGASLIKPTITGTVQKTCAESERSFGFSIYYMLVNVGGFLGPNLAGWVSEKAGVEKVFVVSAVAALVALGLVGLLFQEPGSRGPVEQRKSLSSFLTDFGRVVTNVRLMALFLCASGFWCMFFLLYGPMAKYVTSDLGASEAALGTLISLEAAMVVLFQVTVGYLTRSFPTARAVFLGILMATAGVAFMGVYPSVYVLAGGILMLAVGEMIYSAHFYKYLGDMAPPDQVGMYMGFAFLPIALGDFFQGHLASVVVPFFRQVVGRPQYMWFAFAGVGVVSAVGLAVLTASNRRREA
jgi:dipeptide/tripeptide permease